MVRHAVRMTGCHEHSHSNPTCRHRVPQHLTAWTASLYYHVAQADPMYSHAQDPARKPPDFKSSHLVEILPSRTTYLRLILDWPLTTGAAKYVREHAEAVANLLGPVGDQ